MPPATSSRIEEVPDEVNGQDHQSDNEPSTSAAATTSNTEKSKKKRNKNKAKGGLEKIGNVLAGKGDGGQKIPQALVDHVVDAVNAQGGVPPDDEAEDDQDGPSTQSNAVTKGSSSSGKGKAGESSAIAAGKRPVSEEEVRKALQIVKAMDMLQGKSGIGGKNRKEMGEYKFWKTQPVPQMGEQREVDNDGPIESSVPREQVRQEPYPLPTNFVWSQIDLEDPEQGREVYELLSNNYVEDVDASFRFQYSAEFLQWALKPPGFHKEWHVGVRGQPKNKLVAFISGIPIHLRVRDHVLDTVEINYLCVHKKLRSKRLAPVLIKEVTRQCHLKGIFQAIYTAGVVLPTPVSTCRYYHRTLNLPKLADIKFTHIPRNTTLARMIKTNELPATPVLEGAGLREMEEKDIEAVESLFHRYMCRFKMAPQYSTAEVRHNFLSGRGKGKIGADGTPGRRREQVTWTYVVEDPTTHAITDFFSFYSLPSQIMKSTKHSMLQAAYMFYYATDAAFEPSADASGNLSKRLRVLITDLLVIANNAKFDVVNAMTLMDNWAILKDLKFGHGDGYLNFYLYNWRTAPLEGYQALPANSGGGQGIGRGVGVVML
ncbi:glycylpeptide N-tetradecanoyltransferase [Tulasnella sp. JGI-2019a]|nr:glycylpeptide N-tetradecanoyltransferase [Tulasnella sp. JGI-2019a]KAG9036227.1 glycylpeptide N-tetradecanoyltransferase [Tulasnella sp. JGI-2019a]